MSLALSAWGCAGPAGLHQIAPGVGVESLNEVGLVPLPEGHDGRDVGFSAMLRGRSVWVFGDTFLPDRASDGLRWRSSSWSWTTDTDSADGLGPFEHALDPAGLAVQLLPHTGAEAAYNRAHEDLAEWGEPRCAAGAGCGSRRTPWPQALITDAAGHSAVVFYLNMETGPGGEWDFRSVSGSVARWDDPDAPASRVEPPLFTDEEPDWGSAALRVGKDIYVYACDFDGAEKPCLLARVPFDSATTRDRYRFWAGAGRWSADWTDAVPVFDGGSLFSVQYNAYLGRYLACYMAGMAGEIFARTAPAPEGPWSGPQLLGRGLPALENWDYALIMHPEFFRENGRILLLSYNRPAGFLEQETRLLELRLR